MSDAKLIATVRLCFRELVELFDCWYANVRLRPEFVHKNELTCYEWHPTIPDRRIESVRYLNGALQRLGIPGVYWGNYLGPFYVNYHRLKPVAWFPTGSRLKVANPKVVIVFHR